VTRKFGYTSKKASHALSEGRYLVFDESQELFVIYGPDGQRVVTDRTITDVVTRACEKLGFGRGPNG
jgi:hypothetical protein